MTTFVIFGLAAIGTFVLRITMTVLDGRVSNAASTQRYVALVSPAVLAAIVASAVMLSAGDVVLPNPFVILALGGGAAAVYRSGNVVAALVVGLPVYWIGSLLTLV